MGAAGDGPPDGTPGATRARPMLAGAGPAPPSAVARVRGAVAAAAAGIARVARQVAARARVVIRG